MVHCFGKRRRLGRFGWAAFLFFWLLDGATRDSDNAEQKTGKGQEKQRKLNA